MIGEMTSVFLVGEHGTKFLKQIRIPTMYPPFGWWAPLTRGLYNPET